MRSTGRQASRRHLFPRVEPTPQERRKLLLHEARMRVVLNRGDQKRLDDDLATKRACPRARARTLVWQEAERSGLRHRRRRPSTRGHGDAGPELTGFSGFSSRESAKHSRECRGLARNPPPLRADRPALRPDAHASGCRSRASDGHRWRGSRRWRAPPTSGTVVHAAHLRLGVHSILASGYGSEFGKTNHQRGIRFRHLFDGQ